MASIASNLKDREDDSEFAGLLKEIFGENKTIEKSVVNGKVVSIDDGYAIIDVGLKSEGRYRITRIFIPWTEIRDQSRRRYVEVFVERIENRDGETVLSREKARREEVWTDLEKSHKKERARYWCYL